MITIRPKSRLAVFAHSSLAALPVVIALPIYWNMVAGPASYNLVGYLIGGVLLAAMAGLMGALSVRTVTLQIPCSKAVTNPGQIVEIAASGIGGSVRREK